MGESDSLNSLILTGMGPFTLDANKTQRERERGKQGALCPKAMIDYKESLYM